MKKSMTDAEVWNCRRYYRMGIAAGITAGIATASPDCWQENIFSYCPGCIDRKSPVKTSARHRKKRKSAGGGRNAPEAVTMLKAQYENGKSSLLTS